MKIFIGISKIMNCYKRYIQKVPRQKCMKH